MKSRGRLIAGASLAVASVIAVTAGITYAGQRNQTVFKSNVLIGVSAPYTGNRQCDPRHPGRRRSVGDR